MAPPPVIRLHPDGQRRDRARHVAAGRTGRRQCAGDAACACGSQGRGAADRQGEAMRRYGQIIGFASAAIAPGQHVHVHNCEMGDFAKDYAYGVDARPTEYFDPPATFQGIRRPDGKVATRNYIGILTSVNCSAHVAGVVADMFRRNPFTGDDPLADFPNVDGVVALTHKTGCGMTQDEPLRAAAPHLGGLRAAPEFLPCHRAGPGLRGEPDRRPDGGTAPGRPAEGDGHPDHGRQPQDGCRRGVVRARKSWRNPTR